MPTLAPFTFCLFDEFQCPDSFCINNRWMCNGLKDCLNGEDELGCPERECKVNEFKCGDGSCLRLWYRCDGQSDCEDGSDEKNCSKPSK